MSSSMTAAKDAVAAVVVAAEGTSSPARYALEERVGVGSFGIVYKARVRGSSEHVAIKVVDLEGSAAELEDVRRELEALASVRCARLVHYLGAHVVGSQLWIVTEYLAGGSLGDLLNSLAAPLAEPVVAGVVAELLEALAYLHGDRRVHRDVKAKNVLVARDGRVKLADFGVATRLTDTSTKRQSLIGTPYWMAPEVLEQSRYGSAADVWSLGITAFELATGKPPHWELHPMKVLFVVPKAPPPKLEGNFSAEATAFVARCLAKAPEERPTCADLLVDAWVAAADYAGVAKPALAAHVAAAARRAPELPAVPESPSRAPTPPAPPVPPLGLDAPPPATPSPPARREKSRAFRSVVAPAIAAAARHAVRHAGDRRREAAAALDDLCKALERVDATLDDGKLTTAFATALASALEKQRASLGGADTPSPGSLASASPASRGASPAGVGAPPR